MDSPSYGQLLGSLDGSKKLGGGRREERLDRRGGIDLKGIKKGKVNYGSRGLVAN
jgi:hypothetical protein